MLAKAKMEIPENCYGWWRIVDTGTWGQNGLDILGPALISLTGHGDRLRMHCLLAYVDVHATKSGVSFSWRGAWEFDQHAGRGTAKVGKDGKLKMTRRNNVRAWSRSSFKSFRCDLRGVTSPSSLVSASPAAQPSLSLPPSPGALDPQ